MKRQKPDSSHKPAKISLNDIGGNAEIINNLLVFVAMPLMHPEVYLHTGVELPYGALLDGPPGCGKTMLANAIVREFGLPLIAFSRSSILSKVSGESEMMVCKPFPRSRGKCPLIFMDEIDAITQKRDNTERERERRIAAQMLTSMEDPVFSMGQSVRPGPGPGRKTLCRPV